MQLNEHQCKIQNVNKLGYSTLARTLKIFFYLVSNHSFLKIKCCLVSSDVGRVPE